MSDPILNPDTNQVHLIDGNDQVQMALQNGGKRVTKMLSPEGKQHWIPDELVDSARQNGGQIMGQAPTGPKAPDMKPTNIFEGSPLEGVRTTLKREYSNFKDNLNPKTLVPSVYHAAVDPETPEESQEFGKGFETKIGPVGRAVDRMAAQPLIHAVKDYASGKVNVDNALSVLPEALSTGAATTVGGKVAETIGAGVKKPMGVPLPEGAEGPVAPTRTASVAHEVGTNVPFTDTPLSVLPGKAVAAARSAVGRPAPVEEAAPVAGAPGTAADTIKEHVQNAVAKIKDDPFGAIKELRANIQQSLAQDGIKNSAKAKAFIDQVVNHVQDKYAEYTLPSVGGGSPDAVPEAHGIIDQGVAGLKGQLFKTRPGVRIAPPEVKELDNPLVQLDANGKPIGTGTARTDFSKAAASEAAKGNPDLWKAGTTGQRLGGYNLTVERGFRRLPDIGQNITEAFDQRNMRIARGVLDKAITSMDPESVGKEPGKQLQQMVGNVDRNMGGQLGKSLELIGKEAPGAQVAVSESAKQNLMAAAQMNPILDGALKKIYAQTPFAWEDLIEARKALREFEGQTGPEGRQAYKAGIELDKSIVASLKQQGMDTAAAHYQGVSGISKWVASQTGAGILRKMLNANSPEAYDHLLSATPEEFQKIINTFRGEKGAQARIDSVLRRGMVDRMKDLSIDNGRFKSQEFLRQIRENQVKLGPDFQRFEILGKGIAQLESDMAVTSRFGVPAWIHSPITRSLIVGVGTVFGGVAGGALAGATVAAGYLAPKLIRYMMTPTGVEELGRFAGYYRYMANSHPTPENERVIDSMARNIQKQMDMMDKKGKESGR